RRTARPRPAACGAAPPEGGGAWRDGSPVAPAGRAGLGRHRPARLAGPTKEFTPSPRYRMPLKIAAFPKCYIDRIAGDRSLSVFDWIAMARDLDADGLEMYDGFFTSLDDAYLDRVGEAIRSAGLAMPLPCCSPHLRSP